MKLLIIVLNKVEKLDDLMTRFTEINVKGATVIHSQGMARVLYDNEESPLMLSLRALLEPGHEENRTIIMAVKSEQIPAIKDAVEDVVGDLSRPDTCVMFAMPIDWSAGISL